MELDLIQDTETTGICDFSKDLADPSHPRIIQIAAQLVTHEGHVVAEFKTPIKPDGFKIDERLVDDNGKPTAFSVNKLTQEYLDRCGMPIKTALLILENITKRATQKVAHNYRFDGFMIKSERARLAMPEMPEMDRYCTMTAMRPILKAQGFSSRGGSLKDCVKHTTGKEMEDAHDAMADVKYCRDVLVWIRQQGLFVPQPRKPAPEAA